MSGMLACTSHSPLIRIRPRAPACEPEILVHRAECRAAIEAFDPEQIVFVGNNHFAGFHYATMPPYCVGLAAHAVPDLGGAEGPLTVPRDAAMALTEHLRDEGFDPAISYRMRVDHAFSQPLSLLAGGLDRYPVIPVFVSVFTPPFVSFRRSRLFGEALGRFVRASGRRTLIMGSGGLSHHPTRYFPLMSEAPPDVFAYQLDGDRGGTMSDAQWFERFARLHVEGAQMAADGRRTARDMRLNPELDRTVLAQLARGDTAAFDDWQAPWVVETAGVGMLELHAWLIAVAAYAQCAVPTTPAATAPDPEAPTAGSGAAAPGFGALTRYYAEVVEYGVGFGMLYGRVGSRMR